MDNVNGGHEKGPPPYEAAVGINASAGGVSHTAENFGPFPPVPQVTNNPVYMPQTVNPTLSGMTAQPELRSVPVVVGVPVFGSHSCTMTCPNCNRAIVTETNTQVGLLAFLICGLLLLCGCWLGCCLIPFCVDGCLDVIHFCPNCKILLGSHKRI